MFNVCQFHMYVFDLNLILILNFTFNLIHTHTAYSYVYIYISIFGVYIFCENANKGEEHHKESWIFSDLFVIHTYILYMYHMYYISCLFLWYTRYIVWLKIVRSTMLFGLLVTTYSQAPSHYCSVRELLPAAFPPWAGTFLIIQPGRLLIPLQSPCWHWA